MASELHPLDNSTTDPPNIISAQDHAEMFVHQHHYSETMKHLREGGYFPLGRDRPVFKPEDIVIEKVNGRFITDNVEDGKLLVLVWGTIILPGANINEKTKIFKCFFVEILLDNDYLVRSVQHQFLFNIYHARPPHQIKPADWPRLKERSEVPITDDGKTEYIILLRSIYIFFFKI
ncbi:hypothetical protein H6P81_017479 [Aristolochia fimbriata]|uniref:NTF2 domain-containing protein n=1 Tax=Aristolochia fimbriata TaxID=158543 RepID=A0AAV7E096_ARIFI|nr:hypothetical protein H6P81_017479 [Aristolochia fimbriata]